MLPYSNNGMMDVQSTGFAMGNRLNMSSLLVEKRERALWLTLNRPEALNAIDPEIVEGVSAALAANSADRTLAAVVITANGRAFCAGADLKAARDRAMSDGDQASRIFVASVSALMSELEGFPAPIIAGVNGLALAGGLELVLSCDLVIAGHQAKFGDAHATYGLLPGAGGSVRLPRRIGSIRAKQMMFTAEFVSADQALDWGLINEVCSGDQLATRLEALVRKIAEKSPLGIRRMKRLVDDGLDSDFASALQHEQRISAEHSYSHDRKEGLAAFAEKRKPIFRGE
jgi:enoyl-CoA hydratase/carnithine racemase